MKIKTQQGFSLVELMVSMAIFILITSVVMVSQRRFGGNILVTNLAYSVALAVREAQAYGISVKSAGSAGADNFSARYGIYFSKQHPNIFVLFADNNDNGYNPSDNDETGCVGGECVTVYKIAKGNSISKFCGGTGGIPNAVCSDSGNSDATKALEIIFKRPDPEPTIIDYKGTGVGNGVVASAVTNDNAHIFVASPQGLTKEVIVRSNGQISVQ